MAGANTTQSLREIPIAKTILLSIVTLGIYYLISVYRNTKDIQEARAQPFGAWQIVFWVGIFVPIVQVVNYVMNGIGLGELRQARNQPASSVWIIALVLTLLAGPVGAIVWAVHFNGSISGAESGSGAGATATA